MLIVRQVILWLIVVVLSGTALNLRLNTRKDAIGSLEVHIRQLAQQSFSFSNGFTYSFSNSFSGSLSQDFSAKADFMVPTQEQSFSLSASLPTSFSIPPPQSQSFSFSTDHSFSGASMSLFSHDFGTAAMVVREPALRPTEVPELRGDIESVE